MKIQLARCLYLDQLETMKKLLDLVGFKFDRRTAEFKYLKSQIMDYIYGGLKKQFQKLENEGIIQPCKCGTNVRKGYSKCICGGSGFCNAENSD